MLSLVVSVSLTRRYRADFWVIVRLLHEDFRFVERASDEIGHYCRENAQGMNIPRHPMTGNRIGVTMAAASTPSCQPRPT